MRSGCAALGMLALAGCGSRSELLGVRGSAPLDASASGEAQAADAAALEPDADAIPEAGCTRCEDAPPELDSGIDAGASCLARFPCGASGYCVWPTEFCAIYLGGGDPIHLDGGSSPGCRPLPPACAAAACDDRAGACQCALRGDGWCGGGGTCAPDDAGATVVCVGI